MQPAKIYPSLKNTRPVRLHVKLISFLKARAKYGESLGAVVERLLKRQLEQEKD